MRGKISPKNCKEGGDEQCQICKSNRKYSIRIETGKHPLDLATRGCHHDPNKSHITGMVEVSLDNSGLRMTK